MALSPGGKPRKRSIRRKPRSVSSDRYGPISASNPNRPHLVDFRTPLYMQLRQKFPPVKGMVSTVIVDSRGKLLERVNVPATWAGNGQVSFFIKNS